MRTLKQLDDSSCILVGSVITNLILLAYLVNLKATFFVSAFLLHSARPVRPTVELCSFLQSSGALVSSRTITSPYTLCLGLSKFLVIFLKI